MSPGTASWPCSRACSGAAVRGGDPARVPQRGGVAGRRRRTDRVSHRHQPRRGRSAAKPLCRAIASTSRRASRRSPSRAASASPGAVQVLCATLSASRCASRTAKPEEHHRADRGVRDRGQRAAPAGLGRAAAGSERAPATAFTEASVAVCRSPICPRIPQSHLCDGFTGDIITNLEPFSRSPW